MIIGIPISTSKNQYYINKAYVDYIKGAGLEPLIITPQNDVDLVTKICDGLVLPGGIDIEPTYYGENNIGSFNVDSVKDEFERKLLYSFMEAKKKIFGICRGFQLIAREYLRGNPDEPLWIDFYQHVSSHALADKYSIPRGTPSHLVTVNADLYGGKKRIKFDMFVNSMHHQALLMTSTKQSAASKIRVVGVTRVGLGQKETGYVIEAFRIEEDGYKILAVQWHPEELKDYKMLQTFFNVESKAAGA